MLLDDKCAFVVECGFLKPAAFVVMDDIPAIIHAVFLEYVILRSTQEIAQFKDGLEALGIATLIQRYPLAMRQLFIHDPTAKVTAQYLADLLKPALSPRGHNQREDEEAVILNWNNYLQDTEGIICAQQLLDEMCRNCPHRCVFIHYTVYLPAGLEDAAAVTPSMILSFVTGAEKAPPMGFPVQPSFKFIADRHQTLPTASTCSLALYLPLALTDYRVFQERMDMAILNTVGFGQV